MSGVGLFTIAKSLMPSGSELLLVAPSQKTKTSLPSIGVERIRKLYDEVKTSSQQMVIIDDADTMTDAAQNALLKLLEEPNSYTSFILTSHKPEQLLPTVRSRTQQYFIPFVSGNVIANEVDAISGLTSAKKQQIKFLSSGLPAELARLVESDEYFRLRSSQMQLVKTLLEAKSYDVLAILIKEKLDRTESVRVIEDAIRLLRLAPSEVGVKKISLLLEAYDAVTNGGNLRLHLVRAML